MKKKKVAVMRNFDFWSDNLVKIEKEEGQFYFEIGNQITTDLAEAVAIILRNEITLSENFWNLEVKDIDYYNINPEWTLYWLSGGDWEWKLMNNYKYNWNDCSPEFTEKFGVRVINILEKSKTLRDIKEGFKRHLSLEKLYEFALERDFINN